MKNRKISTIKSWLPKLKKYPSSRYNMQKIETLNLDAELKKMTLNQLTIVSALLAANFNYGCETTRAHIKQLKEDSARFDQVEKTRTEIPEELMLMRAGNLTLIAGGLAS